MKKFEKRIELYDDGIGSVDYVEHMGDDLTIVNSARVSFGKQKAELDEEDHKLINYLVKHGHTSTYEHNVITFRFKVPLFIRSQHHRHRTWSYNEISRRYTPHNLEFYEPKQFRTQHKSNRQASNLDSSTDPMVHAENRYEKASDLIRRHHRDSLELFTSLLQSGVCKEQARGVLPQNLYTTYYGTVNLNNLLKFVKLRTHDSAQKEIQDVAYACLDIARELWPVAIAAYEKYHGDH